MARGSEELGRRLEISQRFGNQWQTGHKLSYYSARGSKELVLDLAYSVKLCTNRESTWYPTLPNALQSVISTLFWQMVKETRAGGEVFPLVGPVF